MCYNYNITIYANRSEFENIFDAAFKDDRVYDNFENYFYVNSYSYAKLPVITNEDPDYFQFYYWGLIPFWVKNVADVEKIRNQTMNARSESLFDKPSFRSSVRKKRCIIPVCGFFEWRFILGRNYPYYIHLKSRKYFSFAGLWDCWNNPITSEKIYTYSIITCEANDLLVKIHNKKKRMPVILSRDKQKMWIDNKLSDDEIRSLLVPYPDNDMNAYTISRLVTSKTRNRNVPEVIEHYIYPELVGIE